MSLFMHYLIIIIIILIYYFIVILSLIVIFVFHLFIFWGYNKNYAKYKLYILLYIFKINFFNLIFELFDLNI